MNRAADAGTRPQSVYNEELFFLSHDDYVSPGLSVRVMNIHKFMNSKVHRPAIMLQPQSDVCSLRLDVEKRDTCRQHSYLCLCVILCCGMPT